MGWVDDEGDARDQRDARGESDERAEFEERGEAGEQPAEADPEEAEIVAQKQAKRRELEAQMIASILAAAKEREAEEAEARSHLPPPVPLRGEMFQAQAAARPTLSRQLPQLEIAREEATPQDRETEAWLNSLIGECHFLMREVIFRSICQSTHVEDRLGWLDASMKVAETGARVGDSVAKLRSGPSIQESRQRYIIEHVNRIEGGGGSASP
jgi:hypothetical protein